MKPPGFSCPYCGSMSTEELLECLDAIPQLHFDLADPPKAKVYIDRYHHAGDCSEHCFCESKRGGGPGKFYARHLFDDPSRTDAEASATWLRVRVEAARSYRELVARHGLQD